MCRLSLCCYGVACSDGAAIGFAIVVELVVRWLCDGCVGFALMLVCAKRARHCFARLFAHFVFAILFSIDVMSFGVVGLLLLFRCACLRSGWPTLSFLISAWLSTVMCATIPYTRRCYSEITKQSSTQSRCFRDDADHRLPSLAAQPSCY